MLTLNHSPSFCVSLVAEPMDSSIVDAFFMLFLLFLWLAVLLNNHLQYQINRQYSASLLCCRTVLNISIRWIYYLEESFIY
jgi:hypothetical protein